MWTASVGLLTIEVQKPDPGSGAPCPASAPSGLPPLFQAGQDYRGSRVTALPMLKSRRRRRGRQLHLGGRRQNNHLSGASGKGHPPEAVVIETVIQIVESIIQVIKSIIKVETVIVEAVIVEAVVEVKSIVVKSVIVEPIIVEAVIQVESVIIESIIEIKAIVIKPIIIESIVQVETVVVKAVIQVIPVGLDDQDGSPRALQRGGARRSKSTSPCRR